MDNTLYIVSFIRRDFSPNEDYYYYSKEQALTHFNLFRTDDSNLYTKIELKQEETVLDTIYF